MSDYQRVSDALKNGAEPAMLCMTCPWDRYCIQAPSMTSDDVEREFAKAKAKDQADAQTARSSGEKAGLPIGTLLATLSMAGRDRQAPICPVLSLRLRSAEGRTIADSLKSAMQEWPS